MNIVYKNDKIKLKCSSLKHAKRYFEEKVARKLIKVINFLESAETLEDVIKYRLYNFHNLKGTLEGRYAIDIDGRRSSYRLIVLFEGFSKNEVFNNPKSIQVINVEEVSKHYE